MSSFDLSFSLPETFRATLRLFVIIDVLPCIPLILHIKKQGARIQPLKTAAAGLCIMLLFYWFGDRALSVLEIHPTAFAAVGSIIIICYGVELFMGRSIIKTSMEGLSGAAIVPMAFPITTGMGTLATLISLRSEYKPLSLIIAMVVNAGVIYIVLRYINWIEHVLGKVGLLITRSLTGVLLMAMGVQGLGKFIGYVMGVVPA